MLLLVLATVQALLYGWVLGIDRGERAAHEGAHLRIPRFVQWILKYVCPVYLLAILGGDIWQRGRDYWNTLVGDRAAGLSFTFLIAVSAAVWIVIFFAGRRWRVELRLPVASGDRP